ncbi:DUF4968 domain-containing protein, partial [Tunturiibacter empetritectus]
MNGLRFGRVAVLFVLGCVMSVPGLSAQSATGEKGDLISMHRATSAAALPNGLELRDGEARVQITALREDVLRIRVSKTGKMPEDASWAVLPGSRTSSVATVYRAEGGKTGFSTKALQVSVDRATLAVTISDTRGGVLLQDARPVEFHGEHFRIYKRMSA